MSQTSVGIRIPQVEFSFSMGASLAYQLENAVLGEKTKAGMSFSEHTLRELRTLTDRYEYFEHMRMSFVDVREDKVDESVQRLFDKLKLLWVEAMKKAVEEYIPHWRKILPTIKGNAQPIIDAWQDQGRVILVEIARLSRIPWELDKIDVYFLEPVPGGGGDAHPEDRAVSWPSVSIERKPLADSLKGLAHEIAHLNITPTALPFVSDGDAKKYLAFEFMTDIIARQVMVNLQLWADLRLLEMVRDTAKVWLGFYDMKIYYDPDVMSKRIISWLQKYLCSNQKAAEALPELHHVLL